jgi:hypothetical protein
VAFYVDSKLDVLRFQIQVGTTRGGEVLTTHDGKLDNILGIIPKENEPFSLRKSGILFPQLSPRETSWLEIDRLSPLGERNSSGRLEAGFPRRSLAS